MPLVRLIDDPFDLSGYSEHETTDLLGFLAERYPVWPDTARLYKGEIAVANDVTPRTEAQVEQLRSADGLFHVVVYPGDPITAIVTTVAVLALTAAVLLFLTPKIPNTAGQDQSSNNSLGQRVNKARPNGRIEDIFGEVVSVPSLLTVPLLVFDNNLEVEYCFMAVGRGSYEISDVKDGDTPVASIAGAGVSFYGPGTQPGNGQPFLKIGSDINYPLKDVRRSNEVNGQILRVPTDGSLKASNNVRFVYPDAIEKVGTSDLSFGDYFTADAELTISGSIGTGGTLDGVYTMLAVTESKITLANPSAVNTNWDALEVAGQTGPESPLLEGVGNPTVGPFQINHDGGTELVFNFVAPQGVYRLNEEGKNRDRAVTLQVSAVPVDAAGVATGTAFNGTITINGNGNDRRPKGATLRLPVGPAAGYKVAVSRLTPAFHETSETVVDEIRWRDLYSTANIAATDFGDVTTLHSRTYATAGATSVKERKLNCRAVRKVAVRNPNNSFGPILAPSREAADILCHMALDPYIGGRSLWELDIDQIYSTMADVRAYFGFGDATNFGYTFDQDSISFEEMAQSVAQAVFCTAYRQGSVLRVHFERATTDSTLLFNHRNKVPGSETRTVRFGKLNDFDGVELDYVSGEDGAKLTLYVPEDRSAVKPKKIDLIGVVDRRGDAALPTLHAMRAFNKIKYQHTSTEFTALGEASQLVLNELVHVTDNTRPDVWDGEVQGMQGLTLDLSQPFEGRAGITYSAFLQLPSGAVEVRSCTAGPGLYQATLSQAPSEPLAVDPDGWANATYQITAPDNSRPSAFLVSEKGAYDKQTIQLQAINYDLRYYQNDQDFA